MSVLLEQSTTHPMTAAILARVICPERDDWSMEAAQSLLKLRFPDEDLDRFHLLLGRHYSEQLFASEQAELGSYLFVNCFLTLLHERVKRSLEKASI